MKFSYRRLLSFVLVFLLVLAPFAPVLADTPTPITVQRIQGDNRYATSIAISEKGFSHSNYAVIASGADFPDALAGGQLAAYLKAPLLIVHPSGVSVQIHAELERLDVKTVYLLGGEVVVSAAIENELAEKYEVKRLAGEDRIETSKEVVKEITTLLGEPSATYFANSDTFPDALAAGPYVASVGGGMLLTRPYWRVDHGIAFGGPNAISGEPDARIFGPDRYETAIAIAKAYPTPGDSIILVSGLDYPDALSASGYAATQGEPILLTKPEALSWQTADYIKNHEISKVTVMGGPAAVSDAVLTQIQKLTEPEQEAPTLYDVVRVVDGDTIIVNINGKEERVRLIGIDTPESVHPDPDRNTEFGKIASDYTKNLLSGKKVTLETDVQERDRYGRILAYVFLDGVMVNKTLLSAGMAQVATYPPNIKYVDDFTALEKTARENNVGFWGMEEAAPTPEPMPEPTPQPDPPAESTGGYGGRGLDYQWVDANGNPLIKGNINAKGEKIYHTPNSPSYSRTVITTAKGERWFYTEREALNAGWRAPLR